MGKGGKEVGKRRKEEKRVGPKGGKAFQISKNRRGKI